MDGKRRSKLKLLYIMDILRKYSDEEHPLPAKKICEKLAEYGISAERKAIYSDIENLVFYGYDIVKAPPPHAGFFLASREFEIPEIYLLTDAVQSANFISPKKTRELINRLESMMSDEQKLLARKNGIYSEYRCKCSNEEVYISIDTLYRAIQSQKKVTLKYRIRKVDENRNIIVSERIHKVSPYALIWTNDHYYLVCNNEKYNNLMHLRIDRMSKVKITDENIRYFGEVCEYKDRFNTEDYVSKTFNMFGGEEREIELSCKNEFLEQVIDRFGENLHIIGVENGRFNLRIRGMISDGLIGWLLQFGGDIEATAPSELRTAVREKLDILREKYKKS